MPRGTPQKLIDRIERLEVTSARLNVLDERLTTLFGSVRSICDRVDRLEEDQSEVAAWKELFDRVERLENEKRSLDWQPIVTVDDVLDRTSGLEVRIEKLSDKIATVEDGESDFDAKFERVFYRLLSVESHAYRVDDFLNHGIALKGES